MTDDPSAPLEIAYLSQQFPVATETFAASDIAALMALGHRVTVYTVKPRPRDEQELRDLCDVPAGLIIDRPGITSALIWPLRFWRQRRSVVALLWKIMNKGSKAPRTAIEAILCMPRLLEIADRVRTRRCDVAHAFWSRHVGLVLPLLDVEQAPPLRSAFVGAYDLIADDFLVDLTLNAAEVVFSHAEANRDYIERKAPEGALRRIVNRGIPLPPVPNDDKLAPFRFVTASALVPSKNVEGVIRAFAGLFRHEPRATLRIFGDGPDKARLLSIAESLDCGPAITFGGHISRRVLFSELREAGTFILLSTKPSERLPNVVKEALWAGCSVISSNSIGIEQLIPDEGIGSVVDPSDVEAVDRAMSKAVGGSEQTATLRRERARALIRENFSSERSMQRYVDAWREAIARRQRAPHRR
jgi:glycosyltransferase involved in cell wall biosynthesis